MGSSLDLIGSYIIGGIVLVLMTGVIINFQEGAQQATLNEISQVSMAQMSQTMDKEINNLGYRVPGQKIVSLNFRSISFLSDYDNNGVVDTISYTMGILKSGPVVTRRIATPGQRPLSWTTRGAMLLFSGYDSTGAVTTDPARIRGIEASMLTSNVLFENLNRVTGSNSTLTALDGQTSQLTVSHEKILATAVDCQAGAYWHKVMYPRNLGTIAPQIAGTFPTTGNTGGTGSTDTGGTDPGDTGSTDPGDTDPGDTDPGGTDPGGTDPGDTDPGITDPGDNGGITPPSNDPCDPPPGANDPCCCGSGKKYKNCCGGK